jgi:hypothetical protein
MPQWAHDLIVLAGVLVPIYFGARSAAASLETRNQQRHTDNIQKFTAIETKLDPIHEWFISQIHRRL